jgi:hypothetical protein
MKKLALLSTALVMAASPASAGTPTVHQPLKPWNLHFADQSCQLIRTFGDPAKPTTVVLERMSPGAVMTMMVFGGGLRSRPGDRPVTAAFLPFADHRFTSAEVAETVDTKLPAVVFTNVDFLPGWDDKDDRNSAPGDRTRDPARIAQARALEDASAAKVEGLELRERAGARTILATGKLAKANAMMRDCAREQMRDWGLDPDVEEKIVKRAWSDRNLASYLSWKDYPRGALLRGEESIISARLIVDGAGKVARCTSLTNFRAPEFADIVCRNLSKATFRPAELADGRTVSTFVTVRVRWELPDG